MKKILVCTCLLVLMLFACAKDENTPRIRAAVCPSLPPNLFEENGAYRGADMELFDGFCRARGYQCSVTAYDWQGMISAVAGGQADVAFSAISINGKRREAMDFSQPYMDNSWHLVCLPAKKIIINDLSELKKYSIGYARGMVYSHFIHDTLEPQGIYRVKDVEMYQTYNQVLADLRSGKIDLIFMDASVAAAYKKKNLVRDSYVFTGIDYFGFAFPRGSLLREDFNRYLSELGPAKIQAIMDRWMNYRPAGS